MRTPVQAGQPSLKTILATPRTADHLKHQIPMSLLKEHGIQSPMNHLDEFRSKKLRIKACGYAKSTLYTILCLEMKRSELLTTKKSILEHICKPKRKFSMHLPRQSSTRHPM